MKNVFSVLVLISFLAFTGCSSATTQAVGCAIQGGVDAVLAPAIASNLQCTNSAAIEASLQQAGAAVKLCVSASPSPSPLAAGNAKPELSGTALVLCQTLGAGLIQVLGASAIPSAWQCSPTAAVSSLTAVVASACGAIGAPAKH